MLENTCQKRGELQTEIDKADRAQWWDWGLLHTQLQDFVGPYVVAFSPRTWGMLRPHPRVVKCNTKYHSVE